MAAATILRRENAKMLSAGQGSVMRTTITFAFPTTDTTCTVPIEGMNRIIAMNVSHRGSEQVYGPDALYTAGECAVSSGSITMQRSAGTTSGLQVNMTVLGR